MNAEQAAAYIAPFVKLSYPKDEGKLFDILHFAQSRAWKGGKWYGMTAEFNVEVAEDRTIITPPGYNVLLKVNLDGTPVALRDEHFQFHRNGTGSITECCGKNWSPDVYDLGPSPVMFQPYQQASCHCEKKRARCVRIGVRSLGHEDECPQITITGFYPHANKQGENVENLPTERVYTFREAEAQKSDSVCCCSPEEATKKGRQTQNGATFVIDQTLGLLDIYWGRIESISKTVTKNPVEVFAVFDDNKVKLIARLEPWQTEANYKKYRIPDTCKTPCVHGQFKVSQPERIVNGTQRIFFTDDEALVLYSKGVYMMFFKDEPKEGEEYILRGQQALDNQLKEQSTYADIPAQVDGPAFQSLGAISSLDGY